METTYRSSASLFGLLVVLTLSLPGQSDAYLFATSGVEVALHPQGPNLWEMTWESDRPIDLAIWHLNQGLASMAFISSPPCSTVGICLAINDDDLQGGGLQALFFVIDMIEPTDPSSFTGIGNPVVLGLLTTTDPLAIGVNQPEWGTAVAEALFGPGTGGIDGGTAPLTFAVVPEPSALLLLGTSLAALLALRRGSGPPA